MSRANKYSFLQMTLITGIPTQQLEQRRRLLSVPWSSQGYTLEEVKQILGKNVTYRTPAEIGSRAKKSLELLNLLLNGEENHEAD